MEPVIIKRKCAICDLKLKREGHGSIYFNYRCNACESWLYLCQACRGPMSQKVECYCDVCKRDEKLLEILK